MYVRLNRVPERRLAGLLEDDVDGLYGGIRNGEEEDLVVARQPGLEVDAGDHDVQRLDEAADANEIISQSLSQVPSPPGAPTH